MKRKVLYDNGGIVITARELTFSLIIILIMIAAGFAITEEIASETDEKNQKYEQAAKIDNDRELFEYGMRTDVGNAFVSGTLKAVGPVTLPELEGEYAVVEIAEERYTAHTRTVTHTDGKGRSYTTIETYYTWDEVDRDRVTCDKISFLNNEFEYGTIEFPSPKHLTTIKESSRVRYQYYVCNTEYDGTIYARLGNNTISEARFIPDTSLAEAVNYKRRFAKWMIVGFWVIWSLIIGTLVFGFCARNNAWIEDD